MNPYTIMEKYYCASSDLYNLLITHSEMVMNKALAIASKFDVDMDFIKEASLLHDIGIMFTNAPEIYCYGSQHYLCHGYLGAELLEKEGLEAHALVCERHTGVGISKEEIIANNLPLPHRDMKPQSLEEKIICYADNFFSKNVQRLQQEKTVDEVIKPLKKFGDSKVKTFLTWHEKFSKE